MKFRATTGAITSNADSITLADSRTRRRQLARTNKSSASPQKNTSNIALARSQHEAPTNAPAPMAHARLFLFAANSSSQAAATTIHAVGASANGAAPESASKGQSAAIPPDHNPVRHPKAVTPRP